MRADEIDERPKGTSEALLAAFRDALRDHDERNGSAVLAAFEKLGDEHRCSPERLILAIREVQLAWEFERTIHSDAVRMDSRMLRTLVKKTFWVAREWSREFQTPFGEAVLQLAARSDLPHAKSEYLRLPQRLMSLGRDAQIIHRGSSKSRRPAYDDALAGLTEYVKSVTGDYHDPEVSSLIRFATGQGTDENTLRVWRHEHPDALDRARLRLRH